MPVSLSDHFSKDLLLKLHLAVAAGQSPITHLFIMKITLKALFLFLFILAGTIAHAQTNMEDVVYLKNGNIIRGLILEHVTGQSIRIQTYDRSIYNYKYADIEKMTKEELPKGSQANQIGSTGPVNYKSSGYTNITEFGYGSGVGHITVNNYEIDNADYSFGFRTVNGVQLNEHFTLGLGLGYEKYKNAALMPITVDARASVLKGKVSPVFGASAGYAIGFDDASNGLIIHPQFGIKTFISETSAFHFNVGYRWQQQEMKFYSGYTPYSYSEKREKVSFQFITFTTGFSF